ncbi:chitin synthase chs-1-like isoform X2 [Ruditapes philippinarum]|uniref:chitin synthase chs-1-like isoform X2 n=1 Tax=Ruditapes philippinarum TaxID=129788 RepID=UPI00295ABAFF|nr:chitin synthase chs-1-like isoform X2 [Ruditapes philippinarum]
MEKPLVPNKRGKQDEVDSDEMNFKGKKYDFNSPNVESDTTRLSTVYSGMTTELGMADRESKKKFFPKGGQPAMFQSLKRNSLGHTNPAYVKDDDDDDDISQDLACNSGSDMSSGESDVETDLQTPESRSINDSESLQKTKLGNGAVANGGKNFNVAFDDLKENAAPMPPIQNKGKKEQKSWDKFTSSTKENISSSDIKFWDKIFVITKLVVCFLLFFFTLGTAVISKICLVIVTANIYPRKDSSPPLNNLKTLNGTLKYTHEETNVQWIWALIMMAGAPYLFSCFKCLWRLLFQMSGRGSPTYQAILGVLGVETIHSIGLNLMIFVVVPNLDPLSGLLFMLCVGAFPGLMKIIYPTVGPSKLRDTNARPSCTTSIFVTVISFIGAAGQLVALGFWLFHIYLEFNKGFPGTTYTACMIVAPIFTSVYWWENYVYEGKKDSYGIPRLAREMRKSRTKLTLYANFWKMILTLVLPIAIYGVKCGTDSECTNTLYFKHDVAKLNSGIGHIDLTSKKDFGKCNNHLPLVVAAIGILCSGICFKVGKVACKIMTQIVDYSLPLVLTTPTTIGIILWMYGGFLTTDDIGCEIPFPKWAKNDGAKVYFGHFLDDPEIWIPIIAGLIGFVSLLLITNHVWTPGKERLQRTDKLFVQPLYCGIFLDQSMLLNRRRIEKAKHSDAVKTKVTKIPLPDEMKDDGDDNEKSIFRTSETPMIYMCATMWHESENEMTQLLKSIYRTDEDQCIRKYAQFLVGRRDPDYYEFEAHIFFDDAFEGHKEDEYEFKVNEYVRLLMKQIPVSASSIHGLSFKQKPPISVATPYGGRLVWTLPGGNKLIAHLKDKTFIRHRKRWSQVMYMYYFLGYELFNKGLKRKQLQKRADNTYLLALDGDVDFHPQAVLLLVDRMRKNPDVGAACGRIHPIGNGAMVWYQKFEYAVSHWLQKAAEDKFGCVLCSPGCFSLFRGSSLMDDNVMNKYTTPPSEPRHYVQYDQGEDRWLCTLLLQQGHRVEYCAASDALTYAPEGFYEFFNQRRRWTPSTMANIMDLLTDWKNVTKKNAEITLAYIFYQGLLMVSSILTPGTIFLMVLGAINLAYPEIELWMALLVNAIPVAIMVLLCFKAKGDTQLLYAAILSTAYSLVMMIVIVGLLKQASEFGFESITTVFLMFVAGVFVISAFIHPQEFWCIIHGFLYFLAIPSMSMILMLYALGNLHVVSWGTRENKTAAEQVEQKKKEEGRLSGVFAAFAGCCPWGEIFKQREDDKLRVIIDRLDGVEAGIRELSTIGSNRSNMGFNDSISVRAGSPYIVGDNETKIPFSEQTELFSGQGDRANPMFMEEKQEPRDRLQDPYWMKEDEEIRYLRTDRISADETQFWEELIDEYLRPIDANKTKEKEIQAQLIELRNKVCLIFILINSLFIIVVFSLQQVVAESDSLSFRLPWVKGETVEKGQKIEPISVAFTLVFGVLLFVQFICMLMHRLATLLHICAATEIFKKKRSFKMPGQDVEQAEEANETAQAMSYDQVYEFVRDLQKDQDADTASLTSESSFGGQSDIEEEDEDTIVRKREARDRWKRMAKKRRTVHENTLGENFKTNLGRIQSYFKEEETSESALTEESEDINSEKEIEALKKKIHFNRMRNKSLHTLAMLKKDPVMKDRLSRKQILKKEVAKERFKGLVSKALINTNQGKRKISDITEHLIIKRKEEAALQALENIGESSPIVERHEIQVHREDNDNPDYANIAEVNNQSDIGQLRAQKAADSSKNETDTAADIKLGIPKVETDEWPDDDHYTAVQDSIDVLF